MVSQPDIRHGKSAYLPLLYMILGYKMDVIQLICTSIDSVGDEEIGIATVIKIGTECSPTPVCRMNTQIHSDLAEFSISPVQLQCISCKLMFIAIGEFRKVEIVRILNHGGTLQLIGFWHHVQRVDIHQSIVIDINQVISHR